MNGIYQVKVEQLKIASPFLKISAKILNTPISNALKDLPKYFNEAPNVGVEIGGMCIAAVAPGKFERVRLITVNGADKMATVYFIDCNYQGVIPCSQLRILYDSYLKNLNSSCKEFILAEMKMVPDNAYKEKIQILHDLLIGKSLFEVKILKKNSIGRFADLTFSDGTALRNTISSHPILKTLLKPIQLETQAANMSDNPENVFKLNTLIELEPFHSTMPVSDLLHSVPHTARIADYYKPHGPLSFYVHLTDNDDEYQRFQFDIQKYKKDSSPLGFVPPVGTNCFALIKDQLHRAILIKSSDKNTKCLVNVFLLEKGSEVSVDFKCLYRIPREVADIPPFAKQFRLADYKLESVPGLTQSEVDFYFHHITKSKLLTLKIVPGCGSVPICQLFDGNVNILMEIKRWNPHKLRYQEQRKLTQGVYSVKASSIESPKCFYVQWQNPAEKTRLLNLSDNLRIIDPPKLRNPAVNDACIVQLELNNMRGRIIKKTTSEIYKVQFIDIGFTDDVHIKDIKLSVEEFMKPPPFAFKCCMEGFERLEIMKQETLKEFDDIMKDADTFNMLVKQKMSDFYIVEMEDTSNGSIVGSCLNKSEWSMPPTPSREHFDKRRGNTSGVLDYSNNEGENGDISHNTLNGSEWNDSAALKALNDDDPNSASIWSDDFKSADVKEGLEAATASSSSSSLGVIRVDETKNERKELCRVTAVVTPNDFTLQKSSTIADYEAFLEELQTLQLAQGPLTAFSVGSFCLALRSFDQKWCRAIISELDLDDFLVTLQCTDDGSMFSVQTKSHLKASSIQLVFKLYFGLNCSLPIHCHPKREKEAAEVLMRMKNQETHYRMITEFQGKRIIELYHDGKNVTDHLIKMGCGKRLSYAPSGKAFICHVKNMTHFAVQMESENDLLNAIEHCTKSYLHVKVSDPKIGMTVLARSTDDFWYRSKIISINRHEFEVFFVDLGYQATVKEVGEIEDEKIRNVHPLAYICSVNLPKEIRSKGGPDGAAEERFCKWAVKKVNIKLVKPMEAYSVVDVFSIRIPSMSFVAELLTMQPDFKTEGHKVIENWH